MSMRIRNQGGSRCSERITNLIRKYLKYPVCLLFNLSHHMKYYPEFPKWHFHHHFSHSPLLQTTTLNWEFNVLLYNADLQGGTMDVLGEILKNIPHKPMKTAISSHSHSFQQIPFPNSPPPFKPLNDYQSPPSLNSLHAEYGVPHQEYGMPLVYSHEYMSSLSSNKQSVMVDPKAYDAYHSMKNRKINPQHNSLRSQSTLSSSLPGLDHLKAPYEIQKSIEYEIHSRWSLKSRKL